MSDKTKFDPMDDKALFGSQAAIQKEQSESASSAGSASEPIRRSFSEKELTDALMEWMQKRRLEGYEPNPNTYLERIGVLYQFAKDLMQNDKVERR